MGVAAAARAGLEVVFEVRVPGGDVRDACGGRRGERRASEIRVHDDARRVDHADERRAHRGAKPRFRAALDLENGIVHGDRREAAGGEAIAEGGGFGAQRVHERRAAVARLERAHRVALAQLFDGGDHTKVSHGRCARMPNAECRMPNVN